MEVATTVSSEVVATAGLSGTPATSGKGSGPSFDSVLEAVSDRMQTANGGVAAEVPKGSVPPSSPDGESDPNGSSDQAEDTAAAAAAAMMVSPLMVSLASEVVPTTAKGQGGEDPMAVSTVAPVQVDVAQGSPSEADGPTTGNSGVYVGNLSSGSGPAIGSGNESENLMPAQTAAQAGSVQAAGNGSEQVASTLSVDFSEAAVSAGGTVQTPRIDGGETATGKSQDAGSAEAQAAGTATSSSQYQTTTTRETRETTAGVVDGFGWAAPTTNGTATAAPKGGVVAGDNATVPAESTVAVGTATETSPERSSGKTTRQESILEGTAVTVTAGGTEEPNGAVTVAAGGTGEPNAVAGSEPGDSTSQGGDQGKGNAGASRTEKAGNAHRGEDRSAQSQEVKGIAASQDSSATASAARASEVAAGNVQGSDREPVQPTAGKSGEQSDARIASLAATRSGETGAAHAASPQGAGNSEGSQTADKGLFDQLLASAAKLSVPRNSSMRVQLKPEALGQLDLRLGLRDGVLTLQILTESERTRDMIQGALPQLRQALEGRAIEVGQMSLGSLVDGSGSWQSGFAASSGAGQWMAGKRYAGAAPQPSLTAEASPVVTQPVPGANSDGRHLVDYRV